MPHTKPQVLAFPVPQFGVVVQVPPPLQGITILLVEDSRYACEALRLMARRAGARLRRAETLEQARAHLRVYRPDIAIVDLGLPDGRGEALIRDLVLARPRLAAVFGISGLPSGRTSALASGADGFMEKPVAGYVEFCAMLAPFLPDRPELEDTSRIDLAARGEMAPPDALSLRDDLSHAAEVMSGPEGRVSRQDRRYVTGFLSGLARAARDPALATASDRAGQVDDPDCAADAWMALHSLVKDRLMQQGPAMAPPEA